MASIDNAAKLESESAAVAETASVSPKIAVMVTIEEYDFDAQQVHVTVGGHDVAIPLSDLIHPCLDRPSGVAIIVDDTMTGHLLLATEDWSLVMPTTSCIPIVVSTQRASYAQH